MLRICAGLSEAHISRYVAIRYGNSEALWVQVSPIAKDAAYDKLRFELLLLESWCNESGVRPFSFQEGLGVTTLTDHG